MSDCWVLSVDTTSGEYSRATEPVAVFTDERAARAALEEIDRTIAKATKARHEHFARQRREVPCPEAYDYREHKTPGTVTHGYFEALNAWCVDNPAPPRAPDDHTLIKVPLRTEELNG